LSSANRDFSKTCRAFRPDLYLPTLSCPRTRASRIVERRAAKLHLSGRELWIPAFAGMTRCPHGPRLDRSLGNPPWELPGFFIFRPIPALGSAARQALHVRPRSSVLLSSFLSSGLSNKRRAGAILWSRVRGTPFARPDGREPQRREKGNGGVHGSPGHSPGTGDRGPSEKTGRSIRCPAEIRPLEGPEPVSGLEDSGRAPALHASRVSHDACPGISSLRFRRLRGVCGRFPSGAFRRPSSSENQSARTSILCKGISEENVDGA
jgi:hypothetical protein